uniref:Fibrinogen C-terminal domain-containing protein n=1 Tax=Amphimedon queenslandica TaxID=400682 RepID=A0A1X7VMY6_AMPQE
MERLVKENQYSTPDEVMHEMKALPSSQPELQCQVQPQHSKKYTGDKWLLRIIAIVLVVILLLLIVIVFMCGFIISQSSPAECSTTAPGATTAGLTATDNRLYQLFNQSLIYFAQEIHKSIGNIVNGATNSTQALVQASIEQLALLVDIVQEIKRKVNSTDDLLEAAVLTNNITNSTKALVHGNIEQLALLVDVTQEIKRNVNYTHTNQLLSHITNVTHINNALAWDHIDALSLIETSLNNNTDLLKTFAASNSDSFSGILNTLSNIQDTSSFIAGVVDDILIVVQELLVAHNISSLLPTSCKQIKDKNPISPSGIYILATANGTSLYYTYCNMEELCGSGGGWTRLAYLDMSDSTVNCPSGFRLYQSGGVRACGRPVTSSGSCVSVQFSSNGISYSQVCGRVTGYQYSSPDSVNSNIDLNSYYVDGVSITRGSPRQHVWSLMAANCEVNFYFTFDRFCPCGTGSVVSVSSFIGDHYFCESGIGGAGFYRKQLYTSDPLWDGEGCGFLESPCCDVPGIPWFHRDYGSTTTTDYIELRVCGDEGTDDEDVPVGYYEIYVQ